MSDLRKKLIKLAYERPELRRHLVPLLKKAAMDERFKEGTILVSSWGYDQTNVDFYQVVKAMGAMVLIRHIASKTVREQGSSELVMPVPDKFTGPVLKRKVGGSGQYLSVSVNRSESAYIWDGKPESQTAFGFGH
jgi:hypothetical protein